MCSIGSGTTKQQQVTKMTQLRKIQFKMRNWALGTWLRCSTRSFGRTRLPTMRSSRKQFWHWWRWCNLYSWRQSQKSVLKMTLMSVLMKTFLGRLKAQQKTNSMSLSKMRENQKLSLTSSSLMGTIFKPNKTKRTDLNIQRTNQVSSLK